MKPSLRLSQDLRGRVLDCDSHGCPVRSQGRFAVSASRGWSRRESSSTSPSLRGDRKLRVPADLRPVPGSPQRRGEKEIAALSALLETRGLRHPWRLRASFRIIGNLFFVSSWAPIRQDRSWRREFDTNPTIHLYLLPARQIRRQADSRPGLSVTGELSRVPQTSPMPPMPPIRALHDRLKASENFRHYANVQPSIFEFCVTEREMQSPFRFPETAFPRIA